MNRRRHSAAQQQLLRRLKSDLRCSSDQRLQCAGSDICKASFPAGSIGFSRCYAAYKSRLSPHAQPYAVADRLLGGHPRLPDAQVHRIGILWCTRRVSQETIDGRGRFHSVTLAQSRHRRIAQRGPGPSPKRPHVSRPAAPGRRCRSRREAAIRCGVSQGQLCAGG